MKRATMSLAIALVPLFVKSAVSARVILDRRSTRAHDFKALSGSN